jgi:hypothetical protein
LATADIKMPTSGDWNFDVIRQHDPSRAHRLEQVHSFDDTIGDVRAALGSAISDRKFRIAVDEPTHNRRGDRAILQFPVQPDPFDAFFNSRRGYRANYWCDPAFGLGAEARLISSLTELLKFMPGSIRARLIKVRFELTARIEEDIGHRTISSEFLTRSLASPLAKVFVCERAIRCTKGALDDLGQSFRDEAFRLGIRRWPKARALYPDLPFCWLDWKGAFLDGGEHFQPKHPTVRAAALHQTGWT